MIIEQKQKIVKSIKRRYNVDQGIISPMRAKKPALDPVETPRRFISRNPSRIV